MQLYINLMDTMDEGLLPHHEKGKALKESVLDYVTAWLKDVDDLP